MEEIKTEVKEDIVTGKINQHADIMGKCLEASLKLVCERANGDVLDKFTGTLNFSGADTPDFNKPVILSIASNIAIKIYEKVVEDLEYGKVVEDLE